ncbi:hypothetical protein VDS41_21800 [Xanthomonas campestris pv. campestris]|nr:hypothetical protein [Xanthomonas campestris pv. campestris]
MIATDAVVADAVKWGELVMPAGGGVVVRVRMSGAECDSSHSLVASKKDPDEKRRFYGQGCTDGLRLRGRKRVRALLMRTTETCWPMHLNIGEMVIGQRGCRADADGAGNAQVVWQRVGGG